MSTQYTKDFFIAKFSAIPEELWCVGTYQANDAFCAYGHCGARYGISTDESLALSGVLNGRVASINDGGDPRYQQPTPRARILAALNDLP